MATQENARNHAARTAAAPARALPQAGPTVRPYMLSQLLADLGSSETKLTERSVARIKKSLPVPSEHEILWADVAFGTRTHGLVLTDAGIFFKDGPNLDGEESDDGDDLVDALGLRRIFAAAGKKRTGSASERSRDGLGPERPKQPVAEGESFELDGIGYHYLRWENFDPARVSHKNGRPTLDGSEFQDAETFRSVAMACVRINNRRVRARKAGRAAVKDSALARPDRPIRSVCRATSKATLDWCFDEDGSYRFLAQDGLPCLLEVPLDQYDAVLQGMRAKIEAGHIASLDDPDATGALVHCGAYTRLQAVNLTKDGRIACASYNPRTGSVVCTDARGLGWWLERWLQLRAHLGAGMLDTSDERAREIAGALGAGLAEGAQAQAAATKDPEALKREDAVAMIGGNAVSTAGYALGSTGARVLFSGLGALAGPLGMVAGMALGDACGRASVEAFGMAKDLIFEPETRIMGRLLGGVLGNVVFENALTRTETALLNEMLAMADPAALQSLGAAIQATSAQEAEIRRFLDPLVQAIRSR